MNAGAQFVAELVGVLNWLIELYKWVVIIAILVVWLIQFNILDRRNRLVFTAADFLYRITEPALRPIRRVVPDFGGIDVTPIILLVLLWVLQIFIRFVGNLVIDVLV